MLGECAATTAARAGGGRSRVGCLGRAGGRFDDPRGHRCHLPASCCGADRAWPPDPGSAVSLTLRVAVLLWWVVGRAGALLVQGGGTQREVIAFGEVLGLRGGRYVELRRHGGVTGFLV